MCVYVCVEVCDRERERQKEGRDLRRWSVCCYSSKLNEGLTMPTSMHERISILLHKDKMFHSHFPH